MSWMTGSEGSSDTERQDEILCSQFDFSKP